ncbi:glycosyltransferase family 4 protein [Prochlorococcus marinus]|uniref:glycosyltransferase family 4 protein n=1 Tax=Prochlorococcus marinus TaxID=1219 RepID=UPI0022B3F3DD|nr:glycosyltransferase family 4 protein [Prochlorococcus marinus]
MAKNIYNPKVLLVANSGWYIYNFRLSLLEQLVAEGFDVHIVVPLDFYSDLIFNRGFTVHQWKISRRSINPIKEFLSLIDLIRIYKREKPIILHHFTIKACIYGTIAARNAGIYKVINAITGLGHVFLSTKKRMRFLRTFFKPLYRALFIDSRGLVVFQNADDQEELIKMGLVNSTNSKLIRGSGVDIDYFKNIEEHKLNKPLKLLFPARLIREKGIQETINACKELWDDNYKFKLIIAGEIDSGNRSSLTSVEIDELKSLQNIVILGHVEDMKSVYADVDIVIMPSWREGLSRSLIEAAAMQRGIITTDVPGCKDVVEHGISGILIPLKDQYAIKLAIQLFYHNPELINKYGLEAREKVKREFQVPLVIKSTVEEYYKLLNN